MRSIKRVEGLLAIFTDYFRDQSAEVGIAGRWIPSFLFCGLFADFIE